MPRMYVDTASYTGMPGGAVGGQPLAPLDNMALPLALHGALDGSQLC